MKRLNLLAVLGVVSMMSGGCAAQRYQTSDGTPFVPKDSYPIWRWDTVQEYKMFGDDHLLTDEQVEQIASMSNFIAIEKQHGKADVGVAELGAAHEARRFKSANPDIKVLFYFNGAIAYEFTRYTKRFSPKKNQMTEQEKKDLLLFDAEENEYVTLQGGHRYAWDILKPSMRTWWSETVGEAVQTTGTDGVFWDQMHGFFWMRQGKGPEIQQAHVDLQQRTSRAMGRGKILLCNNAATRAPGSDFDTRPFIENCDAVMYEHHKPQHYRDNLQKYVDDWDAMLDVANAGKINVYRWGVDLKGTPYASMHAPTREDLEHHAGLAEIAKQRVTFPLACFLIGAQPYSYFQLNWGWGLSSALVDFPEMDRPLGKPLGPYQRESKDAWVFTRQFEHAEVWVDLENEQARITWK